MNLPDKPAIRLAYERAVVAMLNVVPDIEEHEAEAVIDAMAELIFTTFQHYLTQEEKHDTVDHH